MKDLKGDPPEYEGDPSGPDYAMETDDEADEVGISDEVNKLLDGLDVANYDRVDKILGESNFSPIQKGRYLKNLIFIAEHRRNQLKGHKAAATKHFNKGVITKEEKQMRHQLIDRSNKALNQYIGYYREKTKITTPKKSGSGMRKKEGPASHFSTTQKNF